MPSPVKPGRGAHPRGVERDRSRAAGNDHRPAVFAERHVAQRELEIVAELRAGGRADGELRARRADRIGDPGVDIALVDVDAACRARAARRRGSRPARSSRTSDRTAATIAPIALRRDERPAILEERDVSARIAASARSIAGRRLVDIDLDVVDRKLGRLEQIQRRANDELGLARLDLDERVDDRVKLEFVRARDRRACGGSRQADSMPQVANREVSSRSWLRSIKPAA